MIIKGRKQSHPCLIIKGLDNQSRESLIISDNQVHCVGCDLCFVLGVLRAFSWMCSVVCVGYGACVLLGVMCGLTWMCFVHCVGCAWCCMLGSVCRFCWM